MTSCVLVRLFLSLQFEVGPLLVFMKLPLLFVRELFDTFLRSLRYFVFICFFVSLYFPFFALSLWVVLSCNSVKRRVLFQHFDCLQLPLMLTVVLAPSHS